MPAIQFKPKIVPTPDATDFPPEKPRNKDLLCPIITATETATGRICHERRILNLTSRYFERRTGISPFIASRKRTIKNHFVPITLLTFVAPVLPEPVSLISMRLECLTIRYPVGIEPIA